MARPDNLNSLSSLPHSLIDYLINCNNIYFNTIHTMFLLVTIRCWCVHRIILNMTKEINKRTLWKYQQEHCNSIFILKLLRHTKFYKSKVQRGIREENLAAFWHYIYIYGSWAFLKHLFNMKKYEEKNKFYFFIS